MAKRSGVVNPLERCSSLLTRQISDINQCETSQYSSLSENATSTTGCQLATTSEHFLSGSCLSSCLTWVALPGDIAPLSIIREIRERRLKIAGDCVRHSEEVASNVVLWKPSRENPNRWRERKIILTI